MGGSDRHESGRCAPGGSVRVQLITLTASDILFCTSLAGRKGEAPHTAHPAHRLRHPLLHIPCGQEGHALVDPLVEVELLAGQEGEGARV